MAWGGPRQKEVGLHEAVWSKSDKLGPSRHQVAFSPCLYRLLLTPQSGKQGSVEGPRLATILDVELVLVSVVGASARATASPTRLFVRINGGGHPG